MEFHNEHVYRAPDATFSEFRWRIVLGTVDGAVYKISALREAASAKERDRIHRKMMEYLTSRLSRPAETKPNLCIWDTADGNVVLHAATALGYHAVTMTLTSAAVKGFKRIK